MSKTTHSHEASVSSSDLLGDAQALAEKITTALGPAPALTQADVQRSVKLRKGGASVVKTIATLSDQFGLVVPAYPTTTLVAQINQAESLVALHKQLVAATKHVADAMFTAQSKSWAGTTAHYSILRRLAKDDGNVKQTLQSVSQFFSSRSAAVTEEQKEARGGARKGSEKAKANRASKRAAADANAPANGASQAPPATTTQTGAPPSPQATPAPTNGAAH